MNLFVIICTLFFIQNVTAQMDQLSQILHQITFRESPAPKKISTPPIVPKENYLMFLIRQGNSDAFRAYLENHQNRHFSELGQALELLVRDGKSKMLEIFLSNTQVHRGISLFDYRRAITSAMSLESKTRRDRILDVFLRRPEVMDHVWMADLGKLLIYLTGPHENLEHLQLLLRDEQLVYKIPRSDLITAFGQVRHNLPLLEAFYESIYLSRYLLPSHLNNLFLDSIASGVPLDQLLRYFLQDERAVKFLIPKRAFASAFFHNRDDLILAMLKDRQFIKLVPEQVIRQVLDTMKKRIETRPELFKLIKKERFSRAWMYRLLSKLRVIHPI